jgi:hypothetical protein
MPPSYAGLKKLKENIHEKRERHFYEHMSK